jgi:hypothetical protein
VTAAADVAVDVEVVSGEVAEASFFGWRLMSLVIS